MPLEILSPFIILLFAVLLTIFERMFPYIKGQKIFRKEYWNDLLWYTFFQSYLLAFLIAALIKFIDSSTGITRLHLISNWSILSQYMFFFISHEIFQYWFHRFQHKNKYLWRIHEAAHATPEVDWLVGSRSHAGEILIAQTAEFAPIVLLGAAPEIALLKGTVDAVWGMYNHSNINIKTGWLKYVFNGPEMHRWHHVKGKGCINLSTKLSLLDWIWGTAYFPKDKKAVNYGLDVTCDFPYGNYFKQFAYAFRPYRKRKITLKAK